MGEKKTNYDKTREDAEQRFLAYDQEKMIRKFQLEADEAFCIFALWEEITASTGKTEKSSGTGTGQKKSVLCLCGRL